MLLYRLHYWKRADMCRHHIFDISLTWHMIWRTKANDGGFSSAACRSHTGSSRTLPDVSQLFSVRSAIHVDYSGLMSVGDTLENQKLKVSTV